MSNAKREGPAQATPESAARSLWTLLSRTVDRFGDVEGPRLGAAFSFYALFSIFPLALLAVTVLGFLLGEDAHVRERMLATVTGDASVQGVVDQTLAAMQANRAGRGLSFVVGLATLLFGASGALTELDQALNRIWDVPDHPTDTFVAAVKAYAKERFTGMLLVFGIGLVMLASLLSSTVLGAVAAHAPRSRLTPSLLWTAELTASVALLAAVFAATFHLLPRTRPPLRDVCGGALLTAASLTILKSVFALYLARLTSYSAYGVVGGVLALATWIYLSSQVIFLIATLTRVRCETRASKGRPQDSARTSRARRRSSSKTKRAGTSPDARAPSSSRVTTT